MRTTSEKCTDCHCGEKKTKGNAVIRCLNLTRQFVRFWNTVTENRHFPQQNALHGVGSRRNPRIILCIMHNKDDWWFWWLKGVSICDINFYFFLPVRRPDCCIHGLKGGDAVWEMTYQPCIQRKETKNTAGGDIVCINLKRKPS